MKGFLVFILTVGVVCGAPQYAYGPPNYQPPQPQQHHQHHHQQQQQIHSGSGSSIVPGSNFGFGNIGSGNQLIGGSQQNFGSSHNVQQQQQQQHQHQQHEAIVTKQFFIHSAPEEQDEIGGDKVVNLGPGRKHYRVVFIKAPHQSIQGGKVRFVAPANEEKTVIYVLSKKTDLADIAADVQQGQSEPTKPEVHFIKYKTQEEAAHAQRTIQAQYDQLGGTSEVSDEGVAPVQSVIGILGDTASNNVGDNIAVAGPGISQGTDSFGVTGSGINTIAGDSSNNIGATGSYLPPNH